MDDDKHAGEKKPAREPEPAARKHTVTEPARHVAPAATDVQKHRTEEPVRQQVRAPEREHVAATRVQYGQQDKAIVDRLLSDVDQKNAEILRLNNELMHLKLDLKEKDAEIRLHKAKSHSIEDIEEALRDREEALAKKDAENAAYAAKIRNLESKISEMSDQLGTLKKFSDRESIHDSFEDETPAEETTPEAMEDDAEEQAPSYGEDDVASIFRRITAAKSAEPEASGDDNEPPRKLRSAKMYDL